MQHATNNSLNSPMMNNNDSKDTKPNTSMNDMKNILKTIPARFHSKLLLSIDALKKSVWYRQVTDPQKVGEVLVLADVWLQRHQGNTRVYHCLQKVVAELRRMHENQQLFTKKNALTLAAIVLYTISPLDSVPDALPVVGLLDDLLVLMIGLRFMQGKQSETPATGLETSRNA